MRHFIFLFKRLVLGQALQRGNEAKWTRKERHGERSESSGGLGEERAVALRFLTAEPGPRLQKTNGSFPSSP